jgi:GWxTD domain-containing protein
MSRLMRRPILVFLLVLVAASLTATTPAELFQKVKTQFRLGAYTDSLKTLDELDRQGRLPENEKYAESMRPSVAFYRGACLAMLGRSTEARPFFQVFLAYRPESVLDPASYPKEVIHALEESRTLPAAKPPKRTLTERHSIAVAYKQAPNADERVEELLGEDWAEGPVRYLMTAEERRTFDRLSDPMSRGEFIAQFWKVRDTRPETPENEFRLEFDKRVAFADSLFSQDEVRGSLTDRGLVFVMLGPPTWIGLKPLTTGDDRSDPAGMSMYSRNDINAALAGAGNRSGHVWDRMTGPSTKLPSSEANWLEVWHYRKESLPRGLIYQQVDFAFITRKGYGKNVLQRDDAALATINYSRERARGSSKG